MSTNIKAFCIQNLAVYLSGARVRLFLEIRDLGSPTYDLYISLIIVQEILLNLQVLKFNPSFKTFRETYKAYP